MSEKVAQLTVDELIRVVQEAVEQKLIEMLGDPDEGLELREEIKARLRRSLEAEQSGVVQPPVACVPAQEVAAQLDLEW
jgi:hypothetical protein